MGATCSNSAEVSNALPAENNGQYLVGSVTSQETAKHFAIENTLKDDHEKEKLKARLLLLGTGESGKSTIFKQMRIIYGSPKTESELRYYGVVVRGNIIVLMKKLCIILRTSNLEDELDKESEEGEWEDMTLREAYDELVDALMDNPWPPMVPRPPVPEHEGDWCGVSETAATPMKNDATSFLLHAKAIEILWSSKVMKKAWRKRAHQNVNDTHQHYLIDIKRIVDLDYCPTEYDIVTCRVRTTQITMERYQFGKLSCEVIDVGGQRTERRKWIDCFDGVDAVVFVAALSEYDQNLAETKRVNRMVEALDLFESVTKNNAFKNSQIMLFLNKKDIFAEKVQYSNIADVVHFEDYDGPTNDFDQGVLYFIQKFQDRLYEGELGNAFIHITHATNTANMTFVLDALRSIIMRKNIDVFCA